MTAAGQDGERLGRRVREVWVAWAREQPNPKPSWLVPWEGLSELDREVDRRIGLEIAADMERRALHSDWLGYLIRWVADASVDSYHRRSALNVLREVPVEALRAAGVAERAELSHLTTKSAPA